MKKGDDVRGGKDNKEVLTTYTGNVPESAAAHLIPGATGDFTASYGITPDGELRTAELTGTFYAGKPSMTYTMTVDDYPMISTLSDVVKIGFMVVLAGWRRTRSSPS